MATETGPDTREAILDPRRGGAFLFVPAAAEDTLTPERFTDEQRAVAEVPEAFVEREVRAAPPPETAHDTAALAAIVKRMGAFDLLGVEVPAEYGGLGLGRVTATIVTERLGPAGGVAVAQGAHAGLATLPIVFFGTEAQKRRYLPRLVTGELLGAYALTEPGYGSDALNARTTARPTPDGSGFVLNGEKQWISNAGIADLFVVFAQLEGKGFTAFLVEKDAPGASTGREYDKMGLATSSTRPLILQDAFVPADAVLGEPGRGHVVALGILDISRLNLGAGCVGSCKRLIDLSAGYAQGRVQFGQPIARFGLVREKLARMQARTWALEAAVYRTAGLIEGARSLGFATDDAHAAAEYAAECAIVKVLGSEVLGYVADEAVQIHGGNGYMREYEVEGAYRDARIFRIFEGTNEINRLTIPEVVARRAMRGQFPVAALSARLRGEIAAFRRPAFFEAPLDAEGWRVEGARKAVAMVSAQALERLGPDLAADEEALGALADMAIHLYAAESALLRARQGATEGMADLAALSVDEGVAAVRTAAARVIAHVEQGDGRAIALATLDRLTQFPPLDTIELGRRIAARVLGDDAGR